MDVRQLSLHFLNILPNQPIRLVQRAFLLADEYEQEQVGLEDVESACRFLLRHLIRATQSDETRAGLTKNTCRA